MQKMRRADRSIGFAVYTDLLDRLEQPSDEFDAEIALLKSNTYQDQKMLELYRYVDSKFSAFETEFCRVNSALTRECDERRCGDTALANYVNATFYPKMVASVTVGSETTAQAVYNPLPRYGGCNCNR